jgi:U6 snRNA phosphodiesterase
MKRTRLVSYSDSGSDDDDAPRPPLAKKTLPPLSAALQLPVPVDNPALHQGRIRSSPHVDGQFATHIYVCLSLHPSSRMFSLLDQILECAQTVVPTLHPMWPSGHSTSKRELHISLSRCLFLRAYQREDVKRAIRDIAKEHSPWVPPIYVN